MAITATDISDYAPLGNAVLRFNVSTNTLVTNPKTLNREPTQEVLEYLAAVKLDNPQERSNEGLDNNVYNITGRLLRPRLLDLRITAGTEATATINGTTGKFRYTHTLNDDKAFYSDIGQPINGTFTVIGSAAS